jgi:hypothetical protein
MSSIDKTDTVFRMSLTHMMEMQCRLFPCSNCPQHILLQLIKLQDLHVIDIGTSWTCFTYGGVANDIVLGVPEKSVF